MACLPYQAPVGFFDAHKPTKITPPPLCTNDGCSLPLGDTGNRLLKVCSECWAAVGCKESGAQALLIALIKKCKDPRSNPRIPPRTPPRIPPQTQTLPRIRRRTPPRTLPTLPRTLTHTQPRSPPQSDDVSAARNPHLQRARTHWLGRRFRLIQACSAQCGYSLCTVWLTRSCFPRSLADFGQITAGCGNGQCDPPSPAPSSCQNSYRTGAYIHPFDGCVPPVAAVVCVC